MIAETLIANYDRVCISCKQSIKHGEKGVISKASDNSAVPQSHFHVICFVKTTVDILNNMLKEFD
jgi:hypothetical protein